MSDYLRTRAHNSEYRERGFVRAENEDTQHPIHLSGDLTRPAGITRPSRS